MTAISRRAFLDRTKKTGLGLAAGMTILADPRSVWAAPANEKITLAAIGAGGRGNQLAGGFIERGDCQYAFVCDPDIDRAAAMARNVARKGKSPKAVRDFRTILDDKSVDAVIVATPDHWHALATVLACQAGKDVYVEKPATYCCWEGRKMIEAARKYKRIVDVGMQNRSAPYNMEAKEYLASGKLGKIHFCRVHNQKEAADFPLAKDSDPPKGFDWDLWTGPAPKTSFNPSYISRWNYFWRYSGGDIANDGIHQIDLARWLLGLDYPKSVYSTGGLFRQGGGAETPDTQVALYDFDGLLLSFEQTLYTPYMLKISPYIRDSLTEYPYWPQCASRIEIYGSSGLMIVGRMGGGWQVFDRPKREKPVIRAQGNGPFPDPEHKENFIRSLRTRAVPSADIEEGHRSALWVHYANMSYLVGGKKLMIDPKSEEILGNPEAMKFYKRQYRAPYVVPEEV